MGGDTDLIFERHVESTPTPPENEAFRENGWTGTLIFTCTNLYKLWGRDERSNMAREVVDWFTMNGKHIPIFEGESKQDAINRSVADRNEAKKAVDIARNKQVADELNGKVSITSGRDAIANLEAMNVGTPVKLKLTKDGEYKQAIYTGKGEIQGRETYQFYDGEGVDGMFGLSERYISNNGDIKLKLNDNNVEVTAGLLKKLRDRGNQ